jgi:hypothetical protein
LGIIGRRSKPSFCEQKEAKKLPDFDAGRSDLPASNEQKFFDFFSKKEPLTF